MKKFILFIFLFSIYLHTLTPYMGFHDSGEMITCAYLLGVAHPPGYPLFSLLYKLFISILPLGNIAYKATILSALCASFTCLLVSLIIFKLSKSNIAGFIGGATLGLSDSLWLQALICEKYPLASVFFALASFVFLKYLFSKKNKYLFIYFFLFSLSFTHHLQTLFLILPSLYVAIIYIVYSLLLKKIRPMQPIQYIFLLIIFFLPFIVYSYLPIRAHKNPPLNWGRPVNIERIKDHLTGLQYPKFMQREENLFTRLKYHLKEAFIKQFFLATIFILLGAFMLAKKNIIFLIFLLLIFFSSNLYCIQIKIYNLSDYYIPSNIVSAILIGVGICGLRKYKWIALIFPICLLLLNFDTRTRRYYFYPYDYANTILKNTEQNAILLLSGDTLLFPVWYNHYVERYRPDLNVIHFTLLHRLWCAEIVNYNYPHINFSFDKIDLKKLLVDRRKEIRDARFLNILYNNELPVYIVDQQDAKEQNLKTIPYGLLYRVIKEKEKIQPPILNLNFREYKNKDKKAEGVINEYLSKSIEIADYYEKNNNIEKAIKMMQQAIKLSSSPELSLRLARLYEKNNDIYAAIKEYGKIKGSLPAVLVDLGRLYADKLKKYKIAVVYLQEAINKNKKYLPAYINLAAVYILQRDYKKAEEVYLAALKVAPDCRDIKEHLVRLRTKVQ